MTENYFTTFAMARHSATTENAHQLSSYPVKVN